MPKTFRRHQKIIWILQKKFQRLWLSLKTNFSFPTFQKILQIRVAIFCTAKEDKKKSLFSYQKRSEKENRNESKSKKWHKKLNGAVCLARMKKSRHPGFSCKLLIYVRLSRDFFSSLELFTMASNKYKRVNLFRTFNLSRMPRKV